MLKHILFITLIAGTLDIIGACITNYALNGATPVTILKFIASGIFGKAAFEDSFSMAVVGLLCHYLISFACVVMYFILYPKIAILRKSIALSSLLIAIVAWAITTQVIIPLSKINPASFKVDRVIIAICVLYVCIGLPISILTKKYYMGKSSE